MGNKKVKLSDIAAELDVSTGLVSIVLSGKGKQHRVSDVLSEKVVKKAEEMGYQVNQLARGLRTGKSGIIGLLVADIANPYFGKMARCIENEAGKLGYQVMFGSSDEDIKKLSKLIKVFLSQQVDGMIIVPVKNSKKQLAALHKQPVPFVFIDRYCGGIDEDTFCTDNFSGAYQLTRLLIDKGYKKIGALVYDTEITNYNDRIRGYATALKDHDLDGFSEELVYRIGFNYSKVRLESALDDALKKGCDALFFANNNIGMNSLNILDEKNIKIPDDMGIVSFDNPEAFHISKPGITCYEQPVEEMCLRSVMLLDRRINNPDGEMNGITLLPGHIIERESC